MKSTLVPQLLPLAGISVLACCIAQAQLPPQPVGDDSTTTQEEQALGKPAGTDSPYRVVELGPHHRVWQRVTAETNRLGQVQYLTNSYTELETFMHFWREGQWHETKAEIQLLADGAAATNGPHQVLFAANLNTVGAVDLLTPDGLRLRSRILGLSYSDSSTGKAVLIAETKDSIGLLVGRNQVVYTNAFDERDGVVADVQYLYTKAGFEQNVILRTQPPSPAEWGLNPESTRLQVLTEFFDPPVPEKEARTNRQPASFTDELLKFGSMKMGRGRAFVLGAGEPDAGALAVSKQ